MLRKQSSSSSNTSSAAPSSQASSLNGSLIPKAISPNAAAIPTPVPAAAIPQPPKPLSPNPTQPSPNSPKPLSPNPTQPSAASPITPPKSPVATSPMGVSPPPPQTGLKSNQEELPPEREKLVTRREGFLYQLVTIEHQRGCKFGLGIKHYQNKVIVSRVDDGSLSAKSLIAGDRIIDINGVPVSDKDVARDLLLKSLQKTKKVSCIVERACSDDAIALANAALLASEMQPPSVAMASDIRDIVARQREKMNKGSTGGKKGIMRKGGTNQSTNKVQIGDEKKEHIIASDNEGKALKKVAANAK